jgi:hypothetical protein
MDLHQAYSMKILHSSPYLVILYRAAYTPKTGQLAWTLGRSVLLFLAILFPMHQEGQAEYRLEKVMKRGKVIETGLERDRCAGIVGLQGQVRRFGAAVQLDFAARKSSRQTLRPFLP